MAVIGPHALRNSIGYDLRVAREYYKGFNMIKRAPMYEDELKDLEHVYKSKLVHLHQEVEYILPSLLHCMEEFISLHKQNEAIREKLDLLMAKTGRQTSETGDNDCGGSDE